MNDPNTPGATISVGRLKSGDRDEVARMVEIYSPHIYRLGLRMLGDVQDAEDVLQETFLKAIRALPGFEARSNLSTWLYRIAMNEALMVLRKRQRGQVVSVDDDSTAGDDDEAGGSQAIELIDWCCLPEDELMSVEARRCLEQAVQRLSVALRSVFVLRDIEGLSVKETADALSLSEAAVKTRLSRARLQLRDALSGYFGRRAAGLDGEEREEN